MLSKAVLGMLMAASAASQEWNHGFSECVNGVRSMYYYTEDETTCSAEDTSVVSKPPVTNLTCDIHCDRGFFLGVATDDNNVVSSACEKCPEGQYSLGGGILYSETTSSWTSPLPNEIYTECLTRDILSGEWTDSCNIWVASEDGSYISSGDNIGVTDETFALRLVSMLRISGTFVRDGSITFQFNVDSEPDYDGLTFIMDTETMMDLQSESNGWREVTFDVPTGTHTFEWEYSKDYANDVGMDAAQIRSIEMEGTSFADHKCHRCSTDMIQRGNSVCRFCQANQYAGPSEESELDYVCHDCPNNSLAPAGSIGAQACVAQRACEASDYNVQYGECNGAGVRSESYSWTLPQTCSLDLPGAVALPDPKSDVPCGNCMEGYFSDDSGVCSACTNSMYLTASNGTTPGTCQQCPVSTEYPIRTLSFGTGTPEMFSTWPNVISEEDATANSWRLSHEAIIMDSFSADSLQTSTYLSYELKMNVDYASSGSFEFDYALVNLPNDDDASTQVWLELYVDEHEIPLPSGKVSGEHTELIDISTAGAHSIVFNLRASGSSTATSNGARAEIRRLKFVGSAVGGATSCQACPPGSVINADQTGCIDCHAGTASDMTDTPNACGQCPMNTYSLAGSASCIPCGDNMVSYEGSSVCSAPIMIGTTAAPDSGITEVHYDLYQMQGLVTNLNGTNTNQQSRDEFEELFLEAQPSDLINVTDTLSVTDDPTRQYAFGVFQLAYPTLGAGKRINQPGADPTGSYLMELSIKNVKEAGGTFPTDARGFGQVKCNMPTVYGYTNLGRSIEKIVPDATGGGVQVSYTDGDICNHETQEKHRATVNYICDVAAANHTVLSVNVSDCEHTMELRTAMACPVCIDEFFKEVRSECVNGQQSVTLQSTVPCISGSRPPEIAAVTQSCTSITLDETKKKAILAIIVGIMCLILALSIFVVITYRKYTYAQEQAKYFKGQLTRKTNGDETIFEFGDQQNEVSDSQMTGRAADGNPGKLGSRYETDTNSFTDDEEDVTLFGSSEPRSDDNDGENFDKV